MPPDRPSLRCDVLVVGAGPAGCVAAGEAAQAGVSVILIEKRKTPGVPVRCAEFAPRAAGRFIKPAPAFVTQSISGMDSILPHEEDHTTPVNGMMLRRDRFEQALAEKAVTAGVRLELETKLRAITGHLALLSTPGGDVQVDAKVIVGADGPLSKVGGSIGAINKRLVPCAQYRMLLREPSDRTKVYFLPFIPGGYGWVFPQGDEANVGVGVDTRLEKNPRPALDRFVRFLIDQAVVHPDILRVSGGYLPAGGLVRLWRDRVVLAGDAAGTCHPITGAGIYNALLSGEMAGKAAARAVLSSSVEPLRSYAVELASFLGPSLGWAAVKRKHLAEKWKSERFSDMIRSNWIAYKDYYPHKRSQR